MLGCTETVTLRHLVYDGAADADSWQETTLRGVSVAGARAVDIAKAGATDGTLLRLRVPAALCAGYRPAGLFAGESWTAAVGDQLLYAGSRHTVTAVHDNLHRAVNPHLYLEVRGYAREERSL